MKQSFSKKHYAFLAEQVREYLSMAKEDYSTLYYFLEYLSNAFAEDNPNFDREIFLKACGKEE